MHNYAVCSYLSVESSDSYRHAVPCAWTHNTFSRLHSEMFQSIWKANVLLDSLVDKTKARLTGHFRQPIAEAIWYGTRCRGFLQFYLCTHTHVFMRDWNEPCLPLSFQLKLPCRPTVFTVSGGIEGYVKCHWPIARLWHSKWRDVRWWHLVITIV